MREHLPDCDHVPVVVADETDPRWVAIRCPKCGASTGYGLDLLATWMRWASGCVAIPRASWRLRDWR